MTQAGMRKRGVAYNGVKLGAAAADTARVWHPYLNPFLVALLRTPVHRLFGRSLAVLTVRGVRTGRRYRFPVRFAEGRGVVYVIPGGHEHKMWWRNLVRPHVVGLRVRGRDLTGVGQAFSGRHDPQIVADGLRTYLARYPASARLRGLTVTGHGGLDERQLHAVLRHEVIVRIVVDGRERAGLAAAGDAAGDTAGAGSAGKRAELVSCRNFPRSSRSLSTCVSGQPGG
jgi:F420H(2)-dependent quinone reductase